MSNTLWHPASEPPRERTQPLLLATKTTWRDKDGKMLEFTGELIHSLNKNMKNVQEAVTMQKTADEVTVKQVHIKDDFWSEIQNRIINVLITL